MADKSVREGVIIDIDTIRNLRSISIEELEPELYGGLDRLHIVSKKRFFDCLTEQTITRLEPEYG
ncbi:hypothetical protein CKO25_19895 [Thiocapsa imhoffii]|uniref:Uncharacterized protein n=1 Tax=Thiocapsa imhoffii TaxID=382777 RepID=A0A9X1BBQ0_9GAMM|nr:hypothetical protein [Thiocapsa imhoffii]